MSTTSRSVFDGQGQVRSLLRSLDWTRSPLGAPERWPPALCAASRIVLDSAFPMFLAWGPELGFLYNDAYLPILGQRHPAALGARFQDIWPEVWQDLLPIIGQALANQPAWFEDLPLTLTRRGYPEPCWFTFSYAPLHDDNGDVAGMFCTCIETTQRVLAERRAAFALALSDALRPLASAHEMLATTAGLLGQQLDLSGVVIGEIDPAQFRVVVHWRASQPASDPPAPLDALGAPLEAALRAGAVVRVDDVRSDPRTAGRALTYAGCGLGALLLVPLFSGGRPVGFVGLGRTGPWHWTGDELAFAQSSAERAWMAAEAARANEALREERDRKRYLFNTIAEGFAVFDRDWTILEVNPEGLRIARVRSEDVVGRNHWELFPEVEDSEVGRMYRRVMATREAGMAEYCMHFPDGSFVWAEVRAYPMQDGAIASFFRDVTDRKLAEDKLRAADQRKDEFLAMLAHELRNPLAPIAAAADLLRLGEPDAARVRHSSAIIARQVRHMTRLVNDLLDVSRVTRGQITLSLAPVAVALLVDEAVEQILPALQARAQQLTVAVPDTPLVVSGDKARLVQVLANLLGNAVKYTPEHGHIAVRAAADAGQAVLTVSDDGIGMERELTGRVFELFAQAQRSSDRSQGGLGLGLALVRNLVELHGGTVGCASGGPGQGSTFTVRLPLTAAAPAQAAAMPAPAAGTARLTVLVVDDNVDAADTLGMLLASGGHRALVEHEPLAALARAGRERPDVCLLDIGLPGMDGYELARRLRADPATASCVLVAVTGYGQAGNLAQARAAGFQFHLVKPVDLAALARVLAAVRR